MVQSKLSSKHKMVIGQSAQYHNHQTFTIDVFKNYTTNKDDQNEIFTTWCDICTKKSKKIVKQMISQAFFVCFLK